MKNKNTKNLKNMFTFACFVNSYSKNLNQIES
nr:MAG TPA: hypothetical protein [Caudoviricetes sp.]DAO07289.1 MAG TPA: hypothetical protein [Caudoviricetes sp.]DAZ01377.1 MAG TPA: hypothetical protein [Caudoviricetes sp.]